MTRGSKACRLVSANYTSKKSNHFVSNRRKKLFLLAADGQTKEIQSEIVTKYSFLSEKLVVNAWKAKIAIFPMFENRIACVDGLGLYCIEAGGGNLKCKNTLTN